jgi:hypothetical protein
MGVILVPKSTPGTTGSTICCSWGTRKVENGKWKWKDIVARGENAAGKGAGGSGFFFKNKIDAFARRWWY